MTASAASKKFMIDLRCREIEVQIVLENAGFGYFYSTLKGISQLTDHCVTCVIAERF